MRRHLLPACPEVLFWFDIIGPSPRRRSPLIERNVCRAVNFAFLPSAIHFTLTFSSRGRLALMGSISFFCWIYGLKVRSGSIFHFTVNERHLQPFSAKGRRSLKTWSEGEIRAALEHFFQGRKIGKWKKKWKMIRHWINWGTNKSPPILLELADPKLQVSGWRKLRSFR